MNLDYFNLKDTLECGQCFRWNENSDGSFTGIVGKEIITVKQEGGKVSYSCSDKFFKYYFDFDTDYGEIIRNVSVDNVMKKAVERGKGIRILNQDFYETVISFIISQNNNIPRIKGIIGKFCKEFGENIGDGYYSFPKAENIACMTEKDLEFLRAGYRDSYIIDASKKIAENKINFEIMRNGSIDEARREISSIKGIGPKVADCILLFCAKRGDAFPTDVWIKKVLHHYYGLENITPARAQMFAERKFGKYAGYAQQYLFYLAREEEI